MPCHQIMLFKADVLAKFDYHTIQNHLRGEKHWKCQENGKIIQNKRCVSHPIKENGPLK